jgi:branched-chain amino acid transport system ATP-binding protein
MTAPVLVLDGVTKAFGGVVAVDGVSFEVAAGEIVAMIGPNGAGKTTCFNLINGQLAPDSGAISLSGMRIDGRSSAAIARLGVGRTFQVAATFASMTVRENVMVALQAHAMHGGQGTVDAGKPYASRADVLLAEVGCAELADIHCATLAYGDAKRLELALALAGEPRLLLMDEPTAGMSNAARLELMRLASAIARRKRIATLFTEHAMDMIFGFADRILVLDRGRLIAAGTPAEIRANALVRAVYLGEDA